MLSRQAFESVVGSVFEVSPSSGNSHPVWLRLLAVNDLPALAPMNPGSMAVPPKPTSAPITTTGFMVQFSGPASQPLLQDTYRFTHDTLGQFSMFIVPGGPGSDTYTAVFNELSGTAVAPAPAPFHLPGKYHPGTEGGNGVSAPAGGAGNGSGSDAGRPAQQPLEPVLRDSLKSKLPE